MTSQADDQAELRRLREENEALRYASLKFGELSERLSRRVRELEQRLEFYRRLCAPQPAARVDAPARHRAKAEQLV